MLKIVFLLKVRKIILDLKYVKFPKGKKVKKLYSVAAAFKPNMILETFGFDENTEIVFYDYSKNGHCI